jgi:exopolysaccharide biosynthesis polyprenyl glycosylphosphotransferase
MSTRARADDSLIRSLDLICIVLAFAAAGGLATMLSRVGLFKWPEVPGRRIGGWPPDYVMLLVASLLLWAAVSAYTGVHKTDRLESTQYAYWRVVRALLAWLGTTEVVIFFLKLQSVSRRFDFSFFTMAGVLILLRRFLEQKLSWRRAQNRLGPRRAIVVGPPREAEWLLNVLSSRPEWYGTIARADLEHVESTLNGNSTNGAGDHADSEPAEVFLLPGSADVALVEQWAVRLLRQGRTVHIVPAIIDTQLFRQSLGDVAGVPAITLETGYPQQALEECAKRATDALLGGVLLLLLSPLMAVVALLVKLTSSGPVIFSQARLGQGGRRFRIFKFRTMRADAEDLLQRTPELRRKYEQNNFKLPEGEDIRVTPLGRILRATSLDELPQLINVLRGEMSLVGPRPIVPDELLRYGDYGSLLLMVKPGMTGNWQVSGRSRLVDYADRVRLDMEYLRDQSFGADLEILIRTVGAVARMDGAH